MLVQNLRKWVVGVKEVCELLKFWLKCELGFTGVDQNGIEIGLIKDLGGKFAV